MVENRTAKDEIRLKQLTQIVNALLAHYSLGMLFDAIANAVPGVDFVDPADREDILNLIRAMSAAGRESEFANEKRPDVSAEPPLSSLN